MLILHTQTESGDILSLLTGPAFRDGVHLYRQPPWGQSRVYRVTQLRTCGVYRRVSIVSGTFNMPTSYQ